VNGDAPSFDVPAAFGRFRVLHQIGAGSLGPVFRGQDASGGRAVAIKVLRLDLPPERALELAEGLATLVERLPVHPAITRVLATGIENSNPYVVSALAPGMTLDVALRQFGPAAIADALPRLATVAAALDRAAETWTWHGNLHPRDLLIADETMLVGLGIAPLVERAGVRLPVRRPYTAPEVVEGRATIAVSDQFALAAMAFEWLFGRRIRGPADSAVVVPELPGVDLEALSNAFTSALAVDPRARFDSCSAFVSDLAKAAGDPGLVDVAAPAKSGPVRREAEGLPLFSAALQALENGREHAPKGLEEEGDEDDVRAVREETRRRLTPAPDVPLPPVDEWNEAADELDAAPATLEVPPAPELPPASDVDIEEEFEDEPEVDTALPSIEDPAMEEPSVEEPADASTGNEWRERASVAALSSRPRQAPRFVEQGGGEVAWQGTLGATPTVHDRPRRFGTASLVAALLIGTLAGGALALYFADRVPVRMVATGPGAGPGGPPDGPTGRGYTDAALPSNPARPEPPQEAAPPAKTTVAPTDSAPASAEVEATPESGSLLVRSTPAGAEVLVNGVRRGVTPLVLRDLPMGTHTVVLTRSGYARAEHRVVITDARPSRSLEARLVAETESGAPAPPVLTPRSPPVQATSGTLVVESRPPGARVIVDGRDMGETPLTLETMAPGDYAVRIEREGYQPVTATIRVVAGERARVAASLVGGQ
jgi:hypothetical protein